jgi:hypothetical protein
VKADLIGVGDNHSLVPKRRHRTIDDIVIRIRRDTAMVERAFLQW